MRSSLETESMLPESLLRPVDRAVQHFLRELNPAVSEEVLQLAALASWQVGQGHACVDLEHLPLLGDPGLAAVHGHGAAKLVSALDAEPLVAAPGKDSPQAVLVHDGRRLYLRRYFDYEQRIIRALQARLAVARAQPGQLAEVIDELFPASAGQTDWQKVACAVAAGGRIGIITGGPGTGKTTTVVRVLGVLQTLAMKAGGVPLRIGLAAPTGKAAARLGESIGGQVAALAVSEAVRAELPTQVSTVHRLLGRRRGSRLPQHDASAPLPHDVIIIDEASMLDLEMTARLLDALRPEAQLILLGDKDQLASVEAGAVFGDLCRRAADIAYDGPTAAWIKAATDETVEAAVEPGPALDQQIVMLRHSHRFAAQSGIGELASAINRGNATQVAQVLAADYPDLGWLDPAEVERGAIIGSIADGYDGYLQAMSTLRPAGGDQAEHIAWAAKVLREFAAFQLLVAVREGRYGTQTLNRRIEQVLASRGLIALGEGAWYPGRPVMVTENDYTTGLMNGDVGLTLAWPHPDGQRTMLRVAFPNFSGDGNPVRLFSPGRLLTVDTVFAMTVHKAQGSEFEHAMCLLPPPDSGGMSRELLYTAVTRAKRRFTLVGPIEVVKAAVQRPTQRVSGLDAVGWPAIGSGSRSASLRK
jgi:exodeoxyribonuclease V alpha subunit